MNAATVVTWIVGATPIVGTAVLCWWDPAGLNKNRGGKR